MADESLSNAVKKVQRQLDAVVQILPTFATRDDLKALTTREELQAAIEPLATRDELRRAIEPLATRDEVRRAVEPLATREDLRVLGAELRAEIAETRRHAAALHEDLRDDTRLIVEHLLTLSNRVDALSRR